MVENKKLCPECAVEIPKTYPNGQPKRTTYCSNKCAAQIRKRGSIINCVTCKKEFYSSKSHILAHLKIGKFCSRNCYGQWIHLNKMAENHPNWKGGRNISNYGYVILSINGKSFREHRWIMENHLGRKLQKNEDVHHINGVRSDNRIENLVVMDEGDHVRLHYSEKKRLLNG